MVHLPGASPNWTTYRKENKNKEKKENKIKMKKMRKEK